MVQADSIFYPVGTSHTIMNTEYVSLISIKAFRTILNLTIWHYPDQTTYLVLKLVCSQFEGAELIHTVYMFSYDFMLWFYLLSMDEFKKYKITDSKKI